MLATTLSSHWAKDWSRNSSRIKEIVLINLSISKPNGVQPHCLLDWSWGAQTKTHEWRQINTNLIWFCQAAQPRSDPGLHTSTQIDCLWQKPEQFFPAGWSSAKSSNPWLFEARCCIIPRLKVVISCEKVSKCALPRASHTKHHHLKDTPQNTTPKTVGWIIF